MLVSTNLHMQCRVITRQPPPCSSCCNSWILASSLAKSCAASPPKLLLGAGAGAGAGGAFKCCDMLASNPRATVAPRREGTKIASKCGAWGLGFGVGLVHLPNTMHAAPWQQPPLATRHSLYSPSGNEHHAGFAGSGTGVGADVGAVWVLCAGARSRGTLALASAPLAAPPTAPAAAPPLALLVEEEAAPVEAGPVCCRRARRTAQSDATRPPSVISAAS